MSCAAALLVAGPARGAGPAVLPRRGRRTATDGEPDAPCPGRLPVEEDDSTVDYPGDPETESALVAAEDERLTEVRTVGSLARLDADPAQEPLPAGRRGGVHAGPDRPDRALHDRGPAGAGAADVRAPARRVLPALGEPGRRVRRDAEPADPGGLRLLLASDAKGFVSIVNYGGRLNIAGAEAAPAVITSFDRSTERADRLTDDGRAYVRVDRRPGLDRQHRALGPRLLERPHRRPVPDRHRPARTAARSTTSPTRSRSAGCADRTPPRWTGNKNSPLGQVLPAGDLPVPTVSVDSPEYSYVSAAITGTTVVRQRLRPVRLRRQRAGRPVAARSTTTWSRASSCTGTSSTRCIERTEASGNAGTASCSPARPPASCSRR